MILLRYDDGGRGEGERWPCCRGYRHRHRACRCLMRQAGDGAGRVGSGRQGTGQTREQQQQQEEEEQGGG